MIEIYIPTIKYIRGELDSGNIRSKSFNARCPDEGRVCIHGEIVEDQK